MEVSDLTNSLLLLLFYLSLFLSIGWYCAAGVFEPIRCNSLSPSPALPTFLNNNNNNDNNNTNNNKTLLYSDADKTRAKVCSWSFFIYQEDLFIHGAYLFM